MLNIFARASVSRVTDPIGQALVRAGLTLVEDDVYGALCDMPPLSARIPDRAVLVSSLSKAVAPGLRFGFVAAPPALVAALAERLGVAPAALDDPAVKQQLRSNGDDAIKAGVFGVPTLVIDGHLFWGVDGLPFAAAYLADPGLMSSAEMQRLASLPAAAQRTPR